MKFPAITSPDGLIISLDGPYLGKDSDAAIWNDTGIDDRLDAIMEGHTRLFLYGDSVYSEKRYIFAPFRRPANASGRYMTQAQREYNKHLSRDRISVEQAFGLILSQFKACELKSTQRLGLSPIAA